MMKINRNANIPLYVQLTNILIDEIQLLEIGSQIDTEREICSKYDVSRTTTRQALDELASSEYIIKVHGKGNFVANKYVEQPLIEFYSFTDEMRRIGKKPLSKYIDFKSEVASDKVAGKLQINNGEKVYCFRRLRYGDDTALILETTYLPYVLFPDLSLDSLQTSPLCLAPSP